MASRSGPPPRADRLLRVTLPAGISADSIRGDLREEHAALRDRRGAVIADMWFWVEALRVSSRAVVGRASGWMATRGRGQVDRWVEDLRIVARTLTREPGFTLVTSLTLGLGLGANTTIFAVVRSVILKPLPFETPQRVVAFRNGRLEGSDRIGSASFPQFVDIQRDTRALNPVGGWRRWDAALTPGDGTPPARIEAAGATHEVFRIIGVAARLGRTFSASDEDPGATRTAVISNRFWQAVLGRDPQVLGRRVRLNGQDFTVVGVLPSDFRGETSGGGLLPPASVDVWVPYRNSPLAEGIEVRSLSNVNVIARLGEGITIEDAQTDIDRIMAELASTHTEHEGDRGVLIPAPEAVTGDVRSEMVLLMGAVTLVLLLSCVNGVSLIVGRIESRTRELAVRRALGAGRARLLRLLLSEAVVLAALGAVAAAGIAIAGVGGVRALDPGTLPRLQGASFDVVVVTFLVVTTAVVALLLGLLPAVGTVHADPSHALSRGAGGRTGKRRVRSTLVVVQVALATVLLSGAGLLIRSLDAVLRVDPGFRPERVLTARVDHPTPFVSAQWPEHVAFFRTVVERLEQESSVLSAAAAYQDPTDPGWNNSFRLAEQPDDAPLRGAIFRPVTPDYFRTVGIPVLEGRGVLDTDDSDAPGVVVVNQAFARRYYPGESAIGKRLDYGDFWQAREDREYEIVGVVGDVRFAGTEEPVPPAAYFPHAQQPVKEMAFLIRTAGDPTGLVPRVREIVSEVDPTLPVYAVATLEGKLAGTRAERRFLASLLGGFAVLALTLAAIGLYGVLSYLVTRRRREIGVRLAIGARQESVLRLVVRQGMGLVALGIALGVPSALALSRGIRGMLFQVAPADPLTHLVAPLMLVLTGILACLVPAVRATRIDPLEALAE